MKFRRFWKYIVPMALIGLLSLNACAGWFGLGSDSWKEEALQPDGSKLVVERSVSRKGRHEIGQRPSIGEQSLSFTMPDTGRRITWEDAYSEDIGGGNFNPMLLGIAQGKAYVLASPAGCLSYNKWGRPNPPYAVFRHEGSTWRRIALTELPGEFKLPNLIVSSPDYEVDKSGTRFITAAMIGRLNGGDAPLQYKSILREAMPNTSQQCEAKYSNGRGTWMGIGWFKNAKDLAACMRVCELNDFNSATCPCRQFFKGNQQ